MYCTVDVGAALEKILNARAVANLRDDVGVALLREVVHRLLFHAIALRVDKLAIEVGEALRGDVLLVVDFPNLIFALVVEARVFGILHFDFQFVELIGEPRSGRGGGVVVAAAILVDEIADVRVDDLSGELGTGGLVADVHQAAVGYALDAEAAEKRAELGRALSDWRGCRWRSLRTGIGTRDAVSTPVRMVCSASVSLVRILDWVSM